MTENPCGSKELYSKEIIFTSLIERLKIAKTRHKKEIVIKPINQKQIWKNRSLLLSF